MNIILTGKMGTGKSSIAAELSRLTGNKIFSFAGHVRRLSEQLSKARTVTQAWKILLMYLPADLKKEALDENKIPFILSFLEDFALVPVEYPKNRKVQQYVGNELRNSLAEDVWVRLLIPELQQAKGFIIDDCRYRNEAALKVLFPDTIVVKVVVEDALRMDRLSKIYPNFSKSWIEHPSERDIDYILPDRILDHSYTDVAKNAENILEFYGKIKNINT